MSAQSPEIKDLATALMNAQSELKPALKDSTNPHFRSRYAGLQSIWDAARLVLKRNGLAVSQGFDAGNGETVTTWTLLMHTSGQWLRSDLTVKPSKADPQGIGSACTYSKRYGLSAILGIVADEDDDGNGASGHHEQPTREPIGTPVRHEPAIARAVPRAAPAPAAEPSDWRNYPMPAFTKQLGKKLGDLPADKLAYWVNKYEPKPWPNPDSPIKQADLDFRAALDLAKADMDADVPYAR